MSNYKIRKNTTVTDDGHTMKTVGGDVTETMIAEGYDIGSHTHVDVKTRTRIMKSGNTKKKMSTRRCFDNSKNNKKRVMTNIGIIVEHGTTIDTRKASDGEFKNSRCVSVNVHEYKKKSFVEKLLEMRGK
jgi:hypothetical protein